MEHPNESQERNGAAENRFGITRDLRELPLELLPLLCAFARPKSKHWQQVKFGEYQLFVIYAGPYIHWQVLAQTSAGGSYSRGVGVGNTNLHDIEVWMRLAPKNAPVFVSNLYHAAQLVHRAKGG